MTHLQAGEFRGSLLNANLNHKELYMALKALNTSMASNFMLDGGSIAELY